MQLAFGRFPEKFMLHFKLSFVECTCRLLQNVSDAFERGRERADRKSTRLDSSHVSMSYAVFCLKKTETQPPRRHRRRAAERVWRPSALPRRNMCEGFADPPPRRSNAC